MKKIALMALSVLIIVLGIVSCEKEQLDSPLESSQVQKNSKGEQIVNKYIEDNKESLSLEIQNKSSQTYTDFLFRIDMGDYPELTGKSSKYIQSKDELDSVLFFISTELASRYNNYPADIEQDIKEASAIDERKFSPNSRTTYNRTVAKDYALRWAEGRNSSYPDFSTAGGGGDCTNFVSQAVHAGGISMYGSGDGCKHEVNNSEWYVESGGSWNCWGNWSNWEWSTPWAATAPFKIYHQNTGNATVPGWTLSTSTAAAWLNIGDVVQLQRLANGLWSTYHTMVVTEDIYQDLKVSYHSTDTKNKKLSDIPLGTTKRFLLIKF